jgi:hypothetical protein
LGTLTSSVSELSGEGFHSGPPIRRATSATEEVGMKYLIVNTRRTDDTLCTYCGKKLGKQYIRNLIGGIPASVFCSEVCLDMERHELLEKYARRVS